ncbi:MAG: PAS domain-containing protein [Proteobacteria bacterium]|nr:PAS domain-containing protein [Pseudomonadota bacterium]
MQASAQPIVEFDGTSELPAVLASVRDYWRGKRGARAMPARRDIAPAQLKQQLPHILLIDVIEGGTDFRYRLIGTYLRQFFPADPVGRLMSEVIAPFGASSVEATLDAYRGVIEKRAPVRVTGSGAWYAQNPKYFDAMLAPLSDDGEAVNMIFGAFRSNGTVPANTDTSRMPRCSR